MSRLNIIKSIVFVLVSILLVYVFHRYNIMRFLSLDGFNHYRNNILEYEESHVTKFIVVYVLSYILLIAVCIPGTIVFDLIAGFIFGPVVGILLVIFSYTTGSTLGFLIIKYFFREPLIKKFGHLERVVGTKDCSNKTVALNLIGLRFVPIVPFWLLNVLSAIFGVPLTTFFISTLIGIIPTSVIYVIIGYQVKSDMASGGQLSIKTLTNPHLWIPLILLGMIILLPNLVRYVRKKLRKN